jgi:C-terminal processing protease CtpA/Prc
MAHRPCSLLLVPAPLLAAAFALAGPGRADMSEEARAYLTKALDAMQKHSMRSSQIDWDALRRTAFEKAADAQTTADTYGAIRWAVKELKDGHSYFYAPGPHQEAKPAEEPASQASGARAGTAAPPKRKTRTIAGTGWVVASTAEDLRGEVVALEAQGREHRIGYILVPSFGGQESFDPAMATAFAQRLHGEVRRLDGAGVEGWILDLRYNSGGNMWPMLAGIGPLLGTDRVGSFVADGQDPVAWEYNDGKVGTPGSVSVTVAEPLTLRNPMAPVAVLVGKYCTSSGEAVAVALRGRERSRFFGKPTGGATTSTQSVWMGDGAMLFVTNAVFADRTGRAYGGAVEPDEVVADSPDELADPAPAWQDDAAVRAAVSWLTKGP